MFLKCSCNVINIIVYFEKNIIKILLDIWLNKDKRIYIFIINKMYGEKNDVI